MHGYVFHTIIIHDIVQVRLTENKLDIIRSVLDASPTAYKSYETVSPFVYCLTTTPSYINVFFRDTYLESYHE